VFKFPLTRETWKKEKGKILGNILVRDTEDGYLESDTG
jgi:hypothetical protein